MSNVKYILVGVPTGEAVDALKRVIDKKTKDIVDTSLVVTSPELKFIRGLDSVNIVLNGEAPEVYNSLVFKGCSSSFAFEMSIPTHSFFISIGEDEIQFGLMTYDFNGDPIIRGESTKSNELEILEHSLSRDVFGALSLPDGRELKMICEDTNENITQMYRGSWGELKTKDLEDLGRVTR